MAARKPRKATRAPKSAPKQAETPVEAPKAKSGITREIALADVRFGFGHSGFYVTQHYNPDDLIGRKGLKVYTNMRRDEQVKAALTTKKNAIIASGVEVVIEDEERENDKVLDEQKRFIEFNLAEMEGTIETYMLDALSAFDYGFSVTEPVYKAIDYGEWDGRIGWRALKVRRPEQIEFETDQFGNLTPNGIIQGNQPLPAERLAIFTYRKEFGNFYGTSDLREAYRPWFVKDTLIKFMAMCMERYGMPIPVAKTSQTLDGDVKAQLLQIMQNIQARTGIIIPDTIDLTFESPGTGAHAAYPPIFDRLDKWIAMAINVPSLIGAGGGSDETGSYARSETEMDTFLLMIEQARRELQEFFNDQIVKRLIDLNWPVEDGIYVKVKFRELTHERKIEILEQMQKLLTGGVLTKTLPDEQYARDALGLPELSEDEISVGTREAKEQEQKDQIKLAGDMAKVAPAVPPAPATKDKVPGRNPFAPKQAPGKFEQRDYHGEHDQEDHGNWADGVKTNPDEMTDDELYEAMRKVPMGAERAHSPYWIAGDKRDIIRKMREKSNRENQPQPQPKTKLDDFVGGMTKMAGGKALKALGEMVQNRGVMIRRRDLIERMVGDGAQVVTSSKGERRLTTPDDSYLTSSSLTKTGIDYAEWLINQKKKFHLEAMLTEYAQRDPLPRKPGGNLFAGRDDAPRDFDEKCLNGMMKRGQSLGYDEEALRFVVGFMSAPASKYQSLNEMAERGEALGLDTKTIEFARGFLCESLDLEKRTKAKEKDYHADHDQEDHGNWADGKGGSDQKENRVTPERFISARDASKRGAYLSHVTPDDIKDHKLILLHGDKVGAAVSPDGDIQNVFNNGGPKGAGVDALAAAIDAGGETLDCFDEYLPQLYSQMGFVETGRVKFNRDYAPDGWDYEKDKEPDVVFMRWNGYDDDKATSIARAKDRSKWKSHEKSTTYRDDYDAAKSDSRRKRRAGYDDSARRPGARRAELAIDSQSGASVWRHRLAPQFYHADHDQSSHGNWAGGNSADSSKAELQKHLVDYKADRELEGSDAKPIASVIDGAKRVGYLDVPGIDSMHRLMGVPIPSLDTDPEEYASARDRLFKAQPLAQVPMSKLTYTQPRINKERAADLAKLPDQLSKPVSVIKSGGNFYLMNGHHRVVAQHVAGMRTLPANVLDLDDRKFHNLGEWYREYHADHDQLSHGNWAHGIDSATSEKAKSRDPAVLQSLARDIEEEMNFKDKADFLRKNLEIDGTQTKELHTDKDGKYLEYRAQRHEEIIAGWLDKATPVESPTLTIMGGLSGAGKSSIKNSGELDLSNSVQVDADEVRAQLPEYKGWNAKLTQDETDTITSQIMFRAANQRKNIVFDATMKSQKKFEPMITRFKELGYKVNLAFVETPMDAALRNVIDRYKRSGRYVDTAYVASQDHENRSTFDKLKALADDWVYYENPTGKKAIFKERKSK